VQAFWMLLAWLLFTAMAASVKFAAAYFSTAEIVCYRGVLGMLLMWAIARFEGISLRTGFPSLHAWRSLVGLLGLGTWFYAIAYLPLATAYALNSTSSLWVGAFILGGRLLTSKSENKSDQLGIDGWLGLAVLLGFAGVLLLLRPEMPSGELFAGVLGLLSGLFGGWVYVQLVPLAAAGEPATRTVFYFALACALGGAVCIPLFGISGWSWTGAAWLIGVGVLAAVGQWCLTRAYRATGGQSNALFAANLQYSGLLFSALFGIVLFDDSISAREWFGLALIAFSAIAATVLRLRTVNSAIPADGVAVASGSRS
jgi:drug/metabolite transporter (DMT)-like permease